MRLLLAAAILGALVGCGGQKHTRQSEAQGGIRVRMSADSHHPRVGRPWHYEVRVTDSAGRPVAATIHLQILFGGSPVGQVGRHRVANGVWSETIGTGRNAPFPAKARGVPLVFEAVVTAKGQRKKSDYPVEAR